MGTIVKDGTIVYTHIDEIPRGAMEIRLPVPEGYVAEIISDGLIAIRPAESEDEKIRKEIVSFIRAFWVDHRDSVPQISKWLDWLEKQKDSPMPEDTVIFQKGVEEGRRLEREEQKPTPDWMPKFLDELRSKKNYFDWDEHRDIEGHILAIIKWIAPDYFHRKEKGQKPLPGFDDLTPDEKMNHPLYLEGFDAGREVGRVEAEQKPEWSEEDKTMLNNLIWSVHMKSISPLDEMDDRGKYEKYEKFLASLPERFGLQPQQEWSERDETRFNNLCYIIKKAEGWNEVSKNAFIDWLKSFKNRSNFSWKPSKVQIMALRYYLNHVPYSLHKEHLSSLRDDCEKLLIQQQIL